MNSKFRRHSAIIGTMAIMLNLACLNTSAASDKQTTLQAGIELNTKLPSLDPSLAPGNQFDPATAETLLKKAKDYNQWYKIPAWAAGHWSHSKAFTTFSRNEKTGQESPVGNSYMSKAEFDLGSEKDRTGQIWEYEDCGYWTITEMDESFGYAFVTSHIPVASGEETFSFKSQMVSINVDKKTRSIKSCQQRECASSYTSVSPTVMREKEWHRTFDWQGNPEASANNEINCIRTGDAAIDPGRKTVDGRPLQALFIDYLKGHGLTALIPASVAEIESELDDIQPGKQGRRQSSSSARIRRPGSASH